MASPIHFILTGGTIDSYYDGASDTVRPSEKSALPQYISSLRLYDDVIFSDICMKDSRELNIEDRTNILDAIEKSESTRIIVPHGTYTMPDTARYLEANLERKDQTIILTGSLIPLEGFAPSDASFNLGYAVAQVSSLSPGFYVCMNGRTFSPDEVMKDISQGRFDSILGEKASER